MWWDKIPKLKDCVAYPSSRGCQCQKKERQIKK